VEYNISKIDEQLTKKKNRTERERKKKKAKFSLKSKN